MYFILLLKEITFILTYSLYNTTSDLLNLSYLNNMIRKVCIVKPDTSGECTQTFWELKEKWFFHFFQKF